MVSSYSSSFGNASDSDLSYFSATSLGTAATVSTSASSSSNFDDSYGSLGFSSNDLSAANTSSKKKVAGGGKNGEGRVPRVKIRKSYMKKRDTDEESSPETKKDIRLPSNRKRGSSTTGKRIIIKKKVRFSTKRQVRKFQKCSEEEKSQIWYDYDELCDLHEKDRVKTLRKVNMQKLGSSMMPSFTKKGSKSGAGLVDSSSPSSKNYTIRGLEKFVREQNNSDHEEEYQDVRIQKFVQSVVALYERQMFQGRYTPEKLQRFASSKSIKDVEKARAMGQQDALDAHPERNTKRSVKKGGNKKTKELEGTATTPKPTKKKATRSKSSGARLFSKGFGTTKANLLSKPCKTV